MDGIEHCQMVNLHTASFANIVCGVKHVCRVCENTWIQIIENTSK